LDDLVSVARSLVEQDQDGRSNVAPAKALTAAGTEAAPKHLVAATKWSATVSARATTATATISPGSAVALGALTVLVFVKIVIHYFSFVLKLTITIYRYLVFVKGLR
jgi:hypothetical protein